MVLIYENRNNEFTPINNMILHKAIPFLSEPSFYRKTKWQTGSKNRNNGFTRINNMILHKAIPFLSKPSFIVRQKGLKPWAKTKVVRGIEIMISHYAINNEILHRATPFFSDNFKDIIYHNKWKPLITDKQLVIKETYN